MSPENRPTKAQRQSAARDKARQMREQQERAARRRRIGVITLVSLVAVAIVAAVTITITSAGGDDASAAQQTPSSFTADGGFAVGPTDAPVTVDIYLDYQCPVCKQFEATNGPLLAQQRSEGNIQVVYHPTDLLSRFGDYSNRAANAAVCVAEQAPEEFVAFNDTLYDKQPAEGAGGLTDRQLTSLADDAGVPSSVDECITTHPYSDYVTQQTEDRDEQVQGTPTVFVDDQVLSDPTNNPSELEQAIQAAVQGAPAATSTTGSTATTPAATPTATTPAAPATP